ncbi:candidapepsin-4 precursor [Cordyceps fumosorosea ARSEF 2679]|uniref:Candidapepsin-4 n=1 Tax=Cordyceps fumosorosea (strain ARSEF 2679) TaxID=1081104 RepID=A0A168BVP5_CORFA|nr:candidapepsin-4 precursor [Cordyceps fumosorosea ARSEF 2679]OAA70605.1 candidapepsin-4 precursor [Cordyceps fumosorosea ARSEF 2679]
MTATIHLVRHAQGYHNLSKENELLHDPDLTPLGERQCDELRASFPHHTEITAIVSSPMRRALSTSILAFGQDQLYPVVALEDLQEVSDLPSDTGSEVAALGAEFGHKVDLRHVSRDWTDKTMASSFQAELGKLEARARRARLWLRELARGQGDGHIVVVAHGDYMHFLTDEWQGVPELDFYVWKNAEYRSYQFNDVHSSDEDALLIETSESWIRRQGTERRPTRAQQEEWKRIVYQRLNPLYAAMGLPKAYESIQYKDRLSSVSIKALAPTCPVPPQSAAAVTRPRSNTAIPDPPGQPRAAASWTRGPSRSPPRPSVRARRGAARHVGDLSVPLRQPGGRTFMPPELWMHSTMQRAGDRHDLEVDYAPASVVLIAAVVFSRGSCCEYKVIIEPDTGSEGLWVPGASPANGRTGDESVYFDRDASTSAQDLNTESGLQYGAGGKETVWFNMISDEVSVGARARAWDASPASWASVPPLARTRGRGDFVSQKLLDKKIVKTRAFSMALREKDQGLLTFGGYDTSKFSGTLERLPLQPSSRHYIVSVQSVSLTGSAGSGSETVLDDQSIKKPLTIGIDSGWPALVLKSSLYKIVQGKLKATPGSFAQMRVSCDLVSANSSLDFKMTDSTTVSVPLGDMLLRKIGGHFLRRLLVVYDPDASCVYVARGADCGMSIVAIDGKMPTDAVKGKCNEQPVAAEQPDASALVSLGVLTEEQLGKLMNPRIDEESKSPTGVRTEKNDRLGDRF